MSSIIKPTMILPSITNLPRHRHKLTKSALTVYVPASWINGVAQENVPGIEPVTSTPEIWYQGTVCLNIPLVIEGYDLTFDYPNGIHGETVAEPKVIYNYPIS